MAVPVDWLVPAAAGARLSSPVVHQLLLGAAQRAEAVVAASHGKSGPQHQLPQTQVHLPGLLQLRLWLLICFCYDYKYLLYTVHSEYVNAFLPLPAIDLWNVNLPYTNT